MMLPRSVSLLVLHPKIAAGISQHALMANRLWLHKRRTVPPSIRIAYTDKDMTGFMTFAHEHIKGQDCTGASYHALNPELFHFQHATFVETLVAMVNTFIRPLSEQEHEELYQQCCDWYRRYGISARFMPDTWTEFLEYFEEQCDTQLSAGPHFEEFRDQIFAPTDWWPSRVPKPAIRAMLHPRACELSGVEPTARDRRSLRTFATLCRTAAVVPALRAPAGVRAS